MCIWNMKFVIPKLWAFKSPAWGCPICILWGGDPARGGVLPMWWVIHMCRGFDPLFSLWQDRARSFWGIFLIHQQQSYLLGYKNYQFLQKSIFLAPNSIFSSIFLGPIISGQRHTPISFQAEYPPPGGSRKNLGRIWLAAVWCGSLVLLANLCLHWV